MSEQLKVWLFDGNCIQCSVCKTVFDISNDKVNFGTTMLRFPLRCPECGTSIEGVVNA